MIDATERRDGSSQIARFALPVRAARAHNGLPGGNSGREPPDPIPNSEVKTSSADGSVGLSHARVGHRQALNAKPPVVRPGVFLFGVTENCARAGPPATFNPKALVFAGVAVRRDRTG